MKFVLPENRIFESSVVLAILCFSLAAFFPVEDSFQGFLAGIAFLVALPLLFARFVLGRSPVDYGFSFGDIAVGLRRFVAVLLAEIIVLIALSRAALLGSVVHVSLAVQSDFVVFFWYYLFATLLLLPREVFFRGFLFATLRERLSVWTANVIQATCSTLFLMLAMPGETWSFAIFAFGLALASGYIVFGARSIWFAFLFSSVSVILEVAMLVASVR